MASRSSSRSGTQYAPPPLPVQPTSSAGHIFYTYINHCSGETEYIASKSPQIYMEKYYVPEFCRAPASNPECLDLTEQHNVTSVTIPPSHLLSSECDACRLDRSHSAPSHGRTTVVQQGRYWCTTSPGASCTSTASVPSDPRMAPHKF